MKINIGEFRSIFARPYSDKMWQIVCELSEKCLKKEKEVFLEEIKPYLLDQLDYWPDEVRIAPSSWLKDALKKEHHDLLDIARNIDSRNLWLSKKEQSKLLSMPFLSKISIINFESIGGFLIEENDIISMNESVNKINIGFVNNKKSSQINSINNMKNINEIIFSTQDFKRTISIFSELKTKNNIKKLSINTSNISKPSIAVLGQFKALTELKISGSSHIQSMPSFFDIMTSLSDIRIEKIDCDIAIPNKGFFNALDETCWNLKTININRESNLDQFVDQFVTSNNLQNLKKVNIVNAEFALDSIDKILHSKNFYIKDLILNRCNIRINKSTKYFAQIENQLRNIDLTGCYIPSKIVIENIVMHNTDSIEELVIAGCGLNDDVIEQLSKIKLSKIKYLDLSNNKITNKGFSYLLNSQWLNGLRILEIMCSNMTIQVEDLIKENGNSFQSLQEISLGNVASGTKESLNKRLASYLPYTKIRG